MIWIGLAIVVVTFYLISLLSKITTVQNKFERLTYPQCKHAGDPIKLIFAK